MSWGETVYPGASLPEVRRVCVPWRGPVSCEDSLCLRGVSIHCRKSLWTVRHLSLWDTLSSVGVIFVVGRICVLWGRLSVL